MTIEQLIVSKLEPHAKRIKDGGGHDFDFLPAVLLHLMEEQRRQAKLLDDAKTLLTSIKCKADTIVEEQDKNIQARLVDLQSSVSKQIAVLASEHAAHTMQISKGLVAIGSQIESLGSSVQRSHAKFMGLLIAGLVTSSVVIGLAVAILLRH